MSFGRLQPNMRVKVKRKRRIEDGMVVTKKGFVGGLFLNEKINVLEPQMKA